MVDSRGVHVELWRKENSTWVLAAETNDVNQTIGLKSLENLFSLQDFYFEALELIAQQQYDF